MKKHGWWIFAATMGMAACEDLGLNPIPAGGTYDLMYETFVGSRILVQSINGGEPTAPVSGITLVGQEPTASSNGNLIAYVVSDATGSGDIVTVNRTTGGVAFVTADDVFDKQPALSSDGNRIAFVSDLNGPADIFVMNSNGSGRVRLTTDPSPGVWIERSPAWSPDGSQIAFAVNRTGRTQVWIMDANGANPRRLTTSQAFEDDPAWSPDGGRIVYFEVDQDISSLVVLDTDGSNRIVLPTPPDGVSRMPAWTPHNNLIAFTFIPDDGSVPLLYTIRPDGTGLTLRSQDSQGRGALNPVWLRRR